MNVLEKILEEIEHEAMTNKEIGRKQCEGMARAINIVSSHLNEFLNCDIGNNCHVYDIDKITTEEIKPISKEYIDECKEVSKKYKKNTGINNKCSDCSRRKWYQIGYSDAENINIEKIKAINKEMEDYLFEKYCIEGFDEVLDGIFKKYLDLCKNIDAVTNDDWIDCKKSMPTKDMDKKPVWIVYGSLMNLSVEFAYCEWTLSEDEYGNDDSYTQFYIPQAPCSYYPSSNLVHYWKPVDIPNFSEGVRK